jgi:DNA-binding PadR family transcriptional regulator
MTRQLSVSAIAVLHAVASGTAYGFDIIEVTHLSAGTVYPTLTRMEEDDFLTSAWERVELARAGKRPPRRYYQITRAGIDALNEALERVHALKPIRRPRITSPRRV